MEKWGARIMSTQVFANIMTRAVYYARKKTSWYGRQLDKDLLLLFDECCMNLCSVCVVWIFGSKEGASGLTLDQASVMCCRPSPCNVEYYTSMDNIQYTWTGYREYIQHRSGTRLKFWIFNAGSVSYQSTIFGIFLVEIIFWEEFSSEWWNPSNCQKTPSGRLVLNYLMIWQLAKTNSTKFGLISWAPKF